MEDNSLIIGFEGPSRSLCPVQADTETVRFLVTSQKPNNTGVGKGFCSRETYFSKLSLEISSSSFLSYKSSSSVQKRKIATALRS